MLAFSLCYASVPAVLNILRIDFLFYWSNDHIAPRVHWEFYEDGRLILQPRQVLSLYCLCRTAPSRRQADRILKVLLRQTNCDKRGLGWTTLTGDRSPKTAIGQWPPSCPELCCSPRMGMTLANARANRIQICYFGILDRNE